MIYTEESIVALFCTFDFTNYPFDVNTCNMTFRDEDATSDILLFKKLVLEKTVRFRLRKGIFTNVYNTSHKFEITAKKTFFKTIYSRNYSYIGVDIKMSREINGLLIIKFYVATFIYSSLSLVSFLIKADVVSIKSYS